MNAHRIGRMRPRRDPTLPGQGKSKLPKPEGTPKSPKTDTIESDEEEPDVAQSTVLEKILLRFDGLESELKMKITTVQTSVEEGIKAQEFNSKQLEDQIQKHTADLDITKREVKTLGKESDGLQARVTFQNFRLTELELKIEQLERERRRNFMIIEGVEDDEVTTSPEIVDQLFADLKLDFDSHVCDRVYRKGRRSPEPSAVAAGQTGNGNGAKAQNNRPKPIVVGFMRPIEKAKVFKNLKNLKGIDRWDKVYFTDDYTECQKNEIRDLRALAAFARRIGREAKVKNHYLWVEGRRFTYADIKRLGPELTLEKAKGLVINYGEGGATKWENRGSETFCATPSRQGKTFRAPPFKEWKL